MTTSKFYADCEWENAQALCEALEGIAYADAPLCFELITVDEEQIRTLNREQRGIDRITDVLSFPSMDGIFKEEILSDEHGDEIDEEGRIFLGSIVICEKRAKEQAEEYGHSLERELCYLAVHGVLHCLGYDHEVEEDRAIMREAEEKIMQKLGLERE